MIGTSEIFYTKTFVECSNIIITKTGSFICIKIEYGVTRITY